MKTNEKSGIGVRFAAVRSGLFVLGLFLSCGAAAETTVITVTNTPGCLALNYATGDYKLTAGTVHQVEYPSDLGEPLFWFDCRRTNGWTFAENGEVAKIPSIVGNRYLSTDTEGGIHKIAWTPKNPVFVERDEIMQAPVLDFGPKGSLMAMSFDKTGPEGCQTNMLDGIGTVIAVWYSAMGSSSYGGFDGMGTGDWGEGGYYGGAILGGGFGSDGNVVTDKSQYVLYRGTGNYRQYESGADRNRPRWYDNAFVNNAHTHVSIRWGHIRHDGQHTHPETSGFAGGWEVVSVIPREGSKLFNATGLGMNDSRLQAVSGGFKVAEMLIFGKVLTIEETARVEAYLERRWFGRDLPGVNGNALLSRVRAYYNAAGDPIAVQVPVEVPETEKLTIGQLRGGRGLDGSAVVKTGPGTLEIRDASRYDGDVRLGEGTLEFTRRAIPSALPYDIILHFDVSSGDSMVTNAAGEFVLLRNLAEKSPYKLHEICARPSGERLPEILLDEFGEGRHALDFGDYVQDDFSRALSFATNETESVSSVLAKPGCVITVIAVVGAQRGGGGLLRKESNVGYFARASGSSARFDVKFASGYKIGNDLVDKQYVTAMIDSLPMDYANAGYDHPGYQVIAVRSPGSGASIGIGSTPWGSGGMRLCEFLAWNRPLTDDEMRDASAYLMKKWFGKTAPGYDGGNDRREHEINNLVVEGDVKVNVVSGTARVGDIFAAGGSLEKTGDGTLEYRSTSLEEITVTGGAVRKTASVEPASGIAADPALHLDVADPTSMRGETVDGESRVYEWYSQGDRTVMATVPHRIANDSSKYGNYVHAPYLSDEVTLNGYKTLDFGPFTIAAGGRGLSLSRSFDSVRSAYIVWAPRDDSRGTFFGCSNGNADSNGNLYDFLRSHLATNNAALVEVNKTSACVRDGEIFTNGVKVASSVVPRPGEFMLAEFHPKGAAHISAIGTDRDGLHFSGGIRVAEVILYERKLTAREKIVTRNYLMEKWFGAEPETLPEEETSTGVFSKFNVAGEVAVDVADGLGIERLLGEGALEKTGSGELSVQRLCGFTGTVSVAGGVFRLAGRSPTSLGEVVAQDALLFHADSTYGVSTVTNADGVVEVTEWKSAKNDGWSAVPFFDDYRPTLVKANDLNRDYEVVDMGTSSDKQAMLFAKDGVTNLLDNIVTVFWMVGSHNGGGYLLGGGHHYTNWDGGRFNFMRGGTSGGKGTDSSYPLLKTGWENPGNIKDADWYKDGQSVDPLTEALSGGWDLLSMRIVNSGYPSTNADGFAFDGRTLDSMTGWSEHMGSQRLAEVLIYNRKLTDEERLSVEAYLSRKWKYKGTDDDITNSVDFVLSEGAVLDLGAERQYAASLSGSGTVSNGTLAVGRLVIDAEAGAGPVFDETATLAVAPWTKVVVRNASALAAGDAVAVYEGDLADEENLSSRAVEAEGLSSGLRARLRYRDGVLSVRIVPAPTFIVIR